MDFSVSVRWTNQAVTDLEEILQYLEEAWTSKEVEKFKLKLGKDIDLLTKFPYLGSASKSKKDLRRFVLNKHVTIIYQFEIDTISIISLFQNVRKPKF